MEVKEYLRSQSFEDNGAKSFPKGKTILNVNNLDIEEKQFVDKMTGKEKVRWIIKDTSTGESYWCGVKVLKGLDEALKEKPSAKQVEVIKTGNGMDTNYGVIAL